jgi:hypothetical protein
LAVVASRRVRVMTIACGYDRRMRYKLLGFAVWQGARWYVRRRISRLVPSRRVATTVLVAGVVGAVALVAARCDRDQ